MTGVGEKSGTLSTMLLKMADTFNEELNEYIEWLLALMEPVLIIIVAGIVLFTLLTLYLPIITLWKGMASVH
jgi:type II secretory pathway component PulF